MVVNIDKFIDETEAASLGGGLSVSAVSFSPELISNISGTTAATLGTLPGSSIDTSDHPDGSTTGQKFEFQVPDDYDSGDITLSIVYAMSTGVSSPSNVVVLEVGAELAKASDGTVDTATYPLGSVAVTTPDGTTDVARSSVLLQIAAADFAPADRIVFLVKRLGADGSDAHTGDLQLIDYIVSYNGQIAARRTMTEVSVFTDTDEPPPTPGTIASFDTLDYTTGLDEEQKFQFTIPDNWDGVSDFQIQIQYAMSSAVAAAVFLETEGDVSNLGTGGIDPLPPLPFIIPATPDTDIHRTGVIRTILADGRTVGDTVSLKLARRGTDPGDTHTGDLQLIGASVFIGTGASSAVSVLSEIYLGNRVFRKVSGTTTEVLEPADLGGDYDTYAFMTSTSAGARVNVEWQGRLASNQTKLVNIKVPIKGNAGAEYDLKIFVEGTAPPVFGTGLIPAPLSRTEIDIPEGALAAQPAADKRYFVVVEATLDSGEELRVGPPFVRME